MFKKKKEKKNIPPHKTIRKVGEKKQCRKYLPFHNYVRLLNNLLIKLWRKWIWSFLAFFIPCLNCPERGTCRTLDEQMHWDCPDLLSCWGCSSEQNENNGRAFTSLPSITMTSAKTTFLKCYHPGVLHHHSLWHNSWSLVFALQHEASSYLKSLIYFPLFINS